MDLGRQFFNKHTGLLSKWLLPYVVLLIVPLIINIYTYSMMDKVVHDQTVSTNSLALSQVKQNVDKVLSDVHQAYIQLFFLDILKVDHRDSDEATIQYDIHKTVESLKTIGTSYPSISNIILYNQAADFVITASNATGSRNYYEVLNPFGNATYEEFLQTLQGKYAGNLVTAQVNTQGSTPALIYQKTIFDMYDSNYGYNVFFILEDRVLYNQLQQTDLLQNGLFAIVDGQDSHVITTQGDDKLRGELMASLQNGKPHSGTVVSDIKSEVFDLQYYMLMPENRFWAEKRSIGRMFLLSILLCLMLGALVIFSSMRHNYNPLKNLSDIIRRKSGLLQADDDLTSIYQSASNMIEQYSRVLSTQTASLRTAFLQRFVRGREEGDTLEEHFKTYHMDFLSDDFYVALIYIEDYSTFFEGAENLSRDEKFGFAHLTVTNIFEELCADFCQPYYVDLDYTVGYIINLKPDAKNRLRETLAQMQEFVKEHFGIITSIGISGLQKGTANVPMAYNQALEALDYRTVVGVETITEYAQILHGGKAFFYPLDLEQQLIGCIKAGKLEEAQQTLDVIYATNLSDQSLSTGAARCLMFNLISTMMKALSASGETTHTEVNSEQYIGRLFDCKTIQEVRGVVLEMMRDICSVNAQQVQQKDELIPKIIAYIREHYQDPALSVSELAAQFGFHPTYLSNAFKTKTGHGLYDFIKEVRIDAAKTLLKESSETVNAIAQQCGFTNSKTFTRTFKSVTGLTPGKFRDV